MHDTEASRTAMIAAIARGYHRQRHAPPWVLDDPYALSLVGPAWPGVFDGLRAALDEEALDQVVGLICARSRYAEDRLAAGRFGQCVILGAGLDSFAWRRPDARAATRIFEVDHPATQAYKRERIEALSLPGSDHHVFAPVDFETQTLRDGLDAAGLDWSLPILFAWLGVMFYLSADAIEATLRTVASGASGSEIVADYIVTAPYLDEIGQRTVASFERIAVDSGEGFQTFLSPQDMAELVEASGLQVAEDLGREDIDRLYFAGRRDGLTPTSSSRLVAATVP